MQIRNAALRFSLPVAVAEVDPHDHLLEPDAARDRGRPPTARDVAKVSRRAGAEGGAADRAGGGGPWASRRRAGARALVVAPRARAQAGLPPGAQACGSPDSSPASPSGGGTARSSRGGPRGRQASPASPRTTLTALHRRYDEVARTTDRGGPPPSTSCANAWPSTCPR